MLELLAASFEDGWAFIRRGGDILAMKPPYRRTNLSVVSEATVEKAVHAYGFEARAESFDDWTTLIAFLRDRMRAARESQGADGPGGDPVRELIQDAPEAILCNYLDRIESELLPNREWNAASRLLTTLIGSHKVWQDADLCRRTAALLNTCSEQKTAFESAKQELIDEDLARMFPNAVEQEGHDPIKKRAQQVRTLRQTFPMCA